MSRTFLFLGFSLIFLIGCMPAKEQRVNSNIQTGIWRGVLKPQNIELPFNFSVSRQGASLTMELLNAEERIPLSEVLIRRDSIHIPMYIFDATIHAKIEHGTSLKGIWVKNYAEDYIVPFEATFGDRERFKVASGKKAVSFEGKWEVDFIREDGIGKAIGLFNQTGHKVTGTFLKPTGDYRFLEGVVEGNIMKISCFDGTHAYLFEARQLEDGTIEGDFWSGKTWHQKWTARRNDRFELPDPYEMTFMKEGFDTFEIKFPNTSGELIDLADERFRDKIVVVQILGSWCPNCMDETRFYVDWYNRNKDRGVEIVGLAFERKADFEYAKKRIGNMKEKLGVTYEVLIAGTTSAESREKALPMLNKIMSFPTSIILDRQHKVRKIHTGFSGPGTGVYYERFVEDFDLFMDKLLSE
ncbi:MAG: TlpA family protein disulfide reductase [Cytophagales bacterium]|nr:TlpA family protein disulfide reductase [Cytophagales bacterium]